MPPTGGSAARAFFRRFLRLRDDPVFKLLADRRPDGEALASQQTLTRFENLASPQVLQNLIDFTIATGIERRKRHHGGQFPDELAGQWPLWVMYKSVAERSHRFLSTA
jgi:hypothetical protein